MEDGYSKLAYAIIENAVDDYRCAYKRLATNPDDKEAKYLKDECMSFFTSAWCDSLCQDNICGDAIIRRLKKEEETYEPEQKVIKKRNGTSHRVSGKRL